MSWHFKPSEWHDPTARTALDNIDGLTPVKKERLKLLAEEVERLNTVVPRSRKTAKRRAGNTARKKNRHKTRNDPALRFATLGLFSDEDIELAKTVIRRTLERGTEVDPENARNDKYVQAAKLVLEYEYGKPRQMIKVEGEGIKQTVQVVVSAPLNPEVYGTGGSDD